jgi:hypothetical protein
VGEHGEHARSVGMLDLVASQSVTVAFGKVRASLRGRREAASGWDSKAGRCNLYRALRAAEAACRTLYAVTRASSPRDIDRRRRTGWLLLCLIRRLSQRRRCWSSGTLHPRPTCGALPPRAFGPRPRSLDEGRDAWRRSLPRLSDPGQQRMRRKEQRFAREAGPRFC